jgi:hypothetical protein
MTNEHAATHVANKTTTPSSRTYGILLGLGSILMVVFIAMHPSMHGHDSEDFIEEIVRGAAFNGFVHGVIMVISGVVLLGLLGFADRLGMSRLVSRAGLVAYGVGWLSSLGAAAVHGFVVPGVVSWHEGGTPTIEQLSPILGLCAVTGSLLAQIDMVGMSVAAVLWSILLLRRAGATRAIGVLGLLCGLLPLLALVTGHLPMSLHGFGTFILAQAIWYLAIAIQLVRGRT